VTATKTFLNGQTHYSVGKFFCITITKEEWDELVKLYKRKPTELSSGMEIMYLSRNEDIPKELVSKYATKILEAHPVSCNEEKVKEEIKYFEYELSILKRNLDHLADIKALI